MINISMTPHQPTVMEPKLMIVYSFPKVGKTRALMRLPKSYIIDLEDSLERFYGNGINVEREYLEGRHTYKLPKLNKTTGLQEVDANGKPVFAKYKYTRTELIRDEIPKALQAANDANGGKPVFDFGILDTYTVVEELARELATKMYKKTTIGKNFTGEDVVRELEKGLGYSYLREAVQRIISPYYRLFGKCFILSAHVKDASIVKKGGGDITARDLSMTGAIKGILTSKFDATGYLFRSAKGENTITFVTQEQDKATGARDSHVAGKEFVISTLTGENPNEIFTTHWDKIWPSIGQ